MSSEPLQPLICRPQDNAVPSWVVSGTLLCDCWQIHPNCTTQCPILATQNLRPLKTFVHWGYAMHQTSLVSTCFHLTIPGWLPPLISGTNWFQLWAGTMNSPECLILRLAPISCFLHLCVAPAPEEVFRLSWLKPRDFLWRTEKLQTPRWLQGQNEVSCNPFPICSHQIGMNVSQPVSRYAISVSLCVPRTAVNIPKP